MSSNINEVTKSIGEKERTVTANLDEIRELLKQLKQTENNININTTIQNEDTQQNGNSDNLPPSDENFLYDENYNSPFNNLGSDSDAGADSGAGFATTTNLKNLPPLKIPHYKIEYTPTQIKNYHDVASKTARGEDMDIEDSYNIIVNAEKRREYLKRKVKTEDEQKEFQKLDKIYQNCHKEPDEHCIKIKNMWNDAKSRRNYRSNIPQSDNVSSRSSTPATTPRKDTTINKISAQQQFPSIQGLPNNRLPPINIGGKRRSTMKRGKQNKKSQKKSKSHKKSHSHKKRH